MRKLIIILLVSASACGARSSHSTLPAETANAALTRFVDGESLDQIANDFRFSDRDQARDAVHQAMITMQKRYYHER